MSNHPELSVIILCYKAEERIVAFAQKAKEIISKATNSYEIILVGNYQEGSSDTTGKYIAQLAESDPIFRAVSEPKEGMMGWDLKYGLSVSKGEYLCFIDGDGQFPLSSIPVCYEKIKTGKYGLVKTYRDTRKDGLQRKIISAVYNSLFKVLFPKVKGKDINSKPKMMRRDVYEKLNLTYDDWFIDAEIMIKVSRLNIPFYEFPIEFLALEGRKSLVNYSTVFEFIRNLISFRLKSK